MNVVAVFATFTTDTKVMVVAALALDTNQYERRHHMDNLATFLKRSLKRFSAPRSVFGSSRSTRSS